MVKIKLTPEEKKALRIEKKLAKKLELEEQKRQLKRDHLSRELEHGIVTRRKLDAEWTKMLMDIKLPILRTDFQLAVNNMGLLLDIKDFEISFLVDELQEAEEQYSLSLRTHNLKMDNIIRIYERRLNEMKRDYDSEYSSLVQRANWEQLTSREKNEKDQEYINTMNFHLDSDKHTVHTELRTAYYSKLKEYTTENSDYIGLMVNSEETQFEAMWNAYKAVLNDYLINSADKRKSCDKIYNNDFAVCKLIKTQSGQLYDLYKHLFRQKEKQMFEKEDLDKCVQYKKEESCYFNKTYLSLRSNLEQNLKQDDYMLTELVVLSNKVIKELEDKIKLLKTILKIYSLVRKFERHKEKILPFCRQAPSGKTKHLHVVTAVESLIAMDSHVQKELEPFWMKCGQGDAFRHKINEEKEFLKRDNHNLKLHVAKYCAGTKYTCAELKVKSTQMVCKY